MLKNIVPSTRGITQFRNGKGPGQHPLQVLGWVAVLSGALAVSGVQQAIAGNCSAYGAQVEEELTSVPAAWPADIPQPGDLSKIGGLLSTSKSRCTIDLYGQAEVSGADYINHYSSQLKHAGFEQVDFRQEADMVMGRFERGDSQIVVGSDVINARTKREYVEIGVVLTLAR
ncbi:MAG: hypothetical protein AAGA50_01150 [Pseudomonadota bacterium]